MKSLSKRWFTNFLIVVFGLLILFIVGLVASQSLRGLANGALPKYQISGNNLIVYYPNAIANAQSYHSFASDVDPFAKLVNQNNLRYAYLPLQNSYLSANASNEMPTYSLLTFALDTARNNNNAANIATLNSALIRYRQAEIYSNLNYRIENNTLYVHGDFAGIEDSLKTKKISDADVSIANSAVNSPYSGADNWWLTVNIDGAAKYSAPHDGSIALQLLNSAEYSAGGAANQEKTLLSGQSGITPLAFSQDAGMITTAISNYTKQIQHTSSGQGLSISTVDNVDFNGSAEINFSADFTQLLTANQSVSTLKLTDNGYRLWEFHPTDQSDVSGMSWNPNSKQGEYTLDASVGTASEKISTAYSGAKIIEFIALDDKNNVIQKVSKTLTVGADTSSGTQSGGGTISMSVSVPHSISLADSKNASAVPITISASNLNPNGVTGDNRVGKISWYICNKSRTDVMNNDSSGCAEKGSFGPFTQDSFSGKIVNWDASGSAVGTYSVMLKAFALKPNQDASTYPDYPGSSKVLSDDISLTNTPVAGGNNGGQNDTLQAGWAANFKASAITTVDDFIKRLGSFTLWILGFLAVLAIIIAGIRYISSASNPKGAETGKKGILYAVYGIIAAVLSVVLVQDTIHEVQNIIGTKLQTPSNSGQVFFSGLGGPNASVLDIIGQSQGFVWEIIKLAVYYAEAVAVFYILYASFLYMTSYGDDSKAESAKKTLIWSIIGLAFVIAANTLLSLFAGIVT